METQWPSKTTSRVLVVISAYAAFVNMTGAIFAATRGETPLLFETAPYVALFVVFGYFSWRKNRWGYLGAGLTSLLDFAMLQTDPVSSAQAVLQEAARFPFFATFLPFFVGLVVAVPYGLYGFYAASRPQGPSRQISRSSLLALVAVGVIIGGLIVGSIAGGVESRLLAFSSNSGDVTIVMGASSQSNPNFYLPANFTAKVGQSVTWVNRDASAHTVTSTSGVFDSGIIASGATYSFTFTEPGTYQYYCTIHPWMKGTITVTSG
ncbi:MAG: cupredoxin family copper-binding protein [Thaumarchaeota archaeon]|nr:cupredoxin family copper-binding protein [Nitrososphaerota archaeon]